MKNSFQMCLTVDENLDMPQIGSLVESLNHHFLSIGLRCELLKKETGSTKLFFLLEIIKEQWLIPTGLATASSVCFFVVKVFAGEVIKDGHKKVKKLFSSPKEEVKKQSIEIIDEVLENPKILKAIQKKMDVEILENKDLGAIMSIVREEELTFKSIKFAAKTENSEVFIHLEHNKDLNKKSFLLSIDSVLVEKKD